MNLRDSPFTLEEPRMLVLLAPEIVATIMYLQARSRSILMAFPGDIDAMTDHIVANEIRQRLIAAMNDAGGPDWTPLSSDQAAKRLQAHAEAVSARIEAAGENHGSAGAAKQHVVAVNRAMSESGDGDLHA